MAAPKQRGKWTYTDEVVVRAARWQWWMGYTKTNGNQFSVDQDGVAAAIWNAGGSLNRKDPFDQTEYSGMYSEHVSKVAYRLRKAYKAGWLTLDQSYWRPQRYRLADKLDPMPNQLVALAKLKAEEKARRETEELAAIQRALDVVMPGNGFTLTKQDQYFRSGPPDDEVLFFNLSGKAPMLRLFLATAARAIEQADDLAEREQNLRERERNSF